MLENSALIISPNPVVDVLKISMADTPLYSVSILNMEGSVKGQYGEMVDNELDVSHLPAGIYILKIKTTKGQFIMKKFCKI